MNNSDSYRQNFSGAASHDDDQPMCADCGAGGPEWASINRGVLICSECCYVHRNLGRHITQIRSLKKGAWHVNQLALIYVLYKSGSNNIWEHVLLDPQNSSKSKKKPVSNDPIIPKKEAFIKAKYAQLSYAIRPSKEDLMTVDELNKQLWCCVRTSHVETTLRLLALGADPNYADAEKGNTALHNAAREGQALQVELLAIYGADVGQRNAAEQTPASVARLEKNSEVAQRLDELEFEVTDRFSMFLCGRTAEHKLNQHFLIPELVGQTNENVKQYRGLLQNSSSVVLERLIQDVYDEVDRREIYAQWIAAEQFRIGIHQCIAVFLPPNQKLSATRNQLRQKLAKFDAKEFSQLLIDLLKEVRRRYFCLPLPHSEDDKMAEMTIALNHSLDLAASNLDDSRDYDEVADGFFRKSRTSSSTKRSSANPESGDNQLTSAMASTSHLDNYLELKEKLRDTKDKLNSIAQSNSQILNGFQVIQKAVEHLQNDQFDIRNELKNLSTDPYNISVQNPVKRIASPFTLLSPTSASEVGAVIMPTSSLLASKFNTSKLQDQASLLPATMPRQLRVEGSESEMQRIGSAPPCQSNNRNSSTTNGEFQQQGSGIKSLFNDGVFPDNLILETELLTGAIKSLLADLQQQTGTNDANAVFHSDSIGHHITRILRVIPPGYMLGAVQMCAGDMQAAMSALSKKCLARPLHPEETCHAAYDLAKTAKTLLVTVHSRTEFN